MDIPTRRLAFPRRAPPRLAPPLVLAALALATASLPGCGGDASPGGTTTPTTQTPTAMQIVAGNLQTGVVGTELADSLVVKVVDASGAPVKGQVVNFRVTEGGGSTFAGVGTTNDRGLAQERWTLGIGVGTQKLEARAVDPDTGAAILFATFEAIARPRPAAQISVVSGSGQSAAPGTLLPDLLVAKVSDSYGNGVPDVPVTFVVTGGGGSVTPSSARSDASGQVTVAWQLGAAGGLQRCEARSTGLATALFDAEGLLSAVPVASVSVSLSSSSVTVGHSTLATAIVRDASGNLLTGRTVTWISSDPAIASVSPTGVVTAVGLGTAVLYAAVDGKTGSASLTVTPTPPVPAFSTSVNLAQTSIVVGETTLATAVVRDEAGNPLTGRVVQWYSSAGSIALVDATGKVTGLSVGTATITASCEGTTGSATVSVIVPPQTPVATVAASLAAESLYVGQQTQASVVLQDAAGYVLAGRSVTWVSSNPAVAQVNAASGLVTAMSPGTATITAAAEGKTGAALLSVTVVPVTAVAVTLDAAALYPGQTTQARAVLRDPAGNVLAGRSIEWSSSNPLVATVNAATGLVTAVAAGVANVVATSEGKTGSAAVTVSLVPVASVVASVANPNLHVGETTQASAVLRDAAGNELSGRTVTWSSSNEAILVVNGASGLVSAVGTGTAAVIATAEGKSGTVSVTVTPVPVATVGVTLASDTIAVGQVTQASAVLRDASGNVLAGRVVTWISSAPAIASVDATGRVTGLSVGAASIIASSEGRTGSAAVAVIVPPPSPVATVTTSLGAGSLFVGQTTQASAVLRDASGNVLAGRTITWSSSAPSVATVNAATGLVTAVGPGTSSITATSEGKSGSAPLSVSLVPVASVVASVSPASATVGGTAQASAVLRDASGNVLTGRTITWSSSAASVATVNAATGLVTAVGAGTTNLTATSEGQTGSVAFTATSAGCTWTPVRTESLTTVPAGVIPTGGLAGTQGIFTVGGRTAYGTTSDWMQAGIPSGLAATDDLVAVDVDMWWDGVNRQRTNGIMFFADHAAMPSVPFWLNNYGEVQGVWAGIYHYDLTRWQYAWHLPPSPLPASGWGGGELYYPLFPVATTAPSVGWHHLRVEGNRRSCEFALYVDGALVSRFTGSCNAYGGNVVLQSWMPPSAYTGSPQVAFSNLVVSKGSGAACSSWTLVGEHPLSTQPAGAIVKNGALQSPNAQLPAAVGGRTAWLQKSDWNVLEVPIAVTATSDQVAMEADVYLPSSTAAPTTYFIALNKDGGSPYQTMDGVQVFTRFGASGSASTIWQLTTATTRTDIGTAKSHTVTRDAWHTFRIEGRRSTCQFDFLVDGTLVSSATLTGCNTAGTYFTLAGGGGNPSNVAWSNLKVYTR